MIVNRQNIILKIIQAQVQKQAGMQAKDMAPEVIHDPHAGGVEDLEEMALAVGMLDDADTDTDTEADGVANDDDNANQAEQLVEQQLSEARERLAEARKASEYAKKRQEDHLLASEKSQRDMELALDEEQEEMGAFEYSLRFVGEAEAPKEAREPITLGSQLKLKEWYEAVGMEEGMVPWYRCPGAVRPKDRILSDQNDYNRFLHSVKNGGRVVEVSFLSDADWQLSPK